MIPINTKADLVSNYVSKGFPKILSIVLESNKFSNVCYEIWGKVKVTIENVLENLIRPMNSTEKVIPNQIETQIIDGFT